MTLHCNISATLPVTCLPGSMWLQKLLGDFYFLFRLEAKPYHLWAIVKRQIKVKHYLNLQFCIYLAVANFISRGSPQTFLFFSWIKNIMLFWADGTLIYIFPDCVLYDDITDRNSVLFLISLFFCLTEPFQFPIFASLILINAPPQLNSS